ncbi:type VII secretion protein EccB [Microbacterium sp. ru370.1]|uniref:type VII secretion protein EccB n=1 Tax=unclassified Microbacterium TaxID=2609290 RepID=UPI000883C4C4|nr:MULTISPECIES: type VII secretion protein EccB [unclassified Microbacterium]SDO40017.1 type VII secretion protein EccB [Microbacterium sp. ru370.1]SIT79505.1 type VII secretion protein EccB [Microbacterium sp. RU1D]
MATKGDLIEAQNFSRRRLLTAFVSGAPGGKELQPTAPLRAVIAAIALTVIVVLVGVFYGLIRPGLPTGWENGKLVLVSDTGARFVTVDGTLHPVINTASARLLLPANEYGVISTDQATLAGTPVGDTLGITGAPDELPPAAGLLNTGWSACVSDDASLDVRISTATGPTPATDRAAVVSVDGILHVIQGERSFAVSSEDPDAVLRAAGISTLSPISVPASWLDLFTAGTALTPITLKNYGESVSGTSLRVGQVVRQAGAPEDERFLVQTGGVLETLSPLAWQLYQLGSGSALKGEVTEVTGSEIRGLPTAAKGVGDQWPTTGFETVETGQRPCAVLVGAEGQAVTALATQPTSTDISPGVRVDPSHGALVRAGGRGDQNTNVLTLVDATGTAYPLPNANDETIARLGYSTDDIGSIADGWTALLTTGPSLSESAAQRTPEAK